MVTHENILKEIETQIGDYPPERLLRGAAPLQMLLLRALIELNEKVARLEKCLNGGKHGA